MNKTLNFKEITQYLPHRYPFLLVDRVLDYEKGKTISAIKNISVNEPIFSGHFPQKPIFPGVMIIEALAQAAGILAVITENRTGEDGNSFYLAGVDKARFRQTVVPGDQLVLKAKLLATKRNIWKFQTTALIDGKVVASAEIMCVESS